MTNINTQIPDVNKDQDMAPEMPPAPVMDAMTANKILNAALESNRMEPTSIPVEVLEKWGNYNRSSFRVAKKVTYALIIITLLLPLLVYKPGIVAERINVDEKPSASAIYEVDIKGLLPVSSVSATLDGKPLVAHQDTAKKFRVEVTGNGELEITAVSINGQTSRRTYTVNYLDDQCPSYMGSETINGHVFITVEDNYSGIDYDSIEGMKPLSIDRENGIIEFDFPTKQTIVKVPDKAGNVLEMVISPQK